MRLYLLISFFAPLLASIEDHLRKAQNKSSIHSMPSIDFIHDGVKPSPSGLGYKPLLKFLYMINLDQCPEKLRSSFNQLAPYQIYPYRFSTVNGWELSLETINGVGLKFSIEMEKGILGTCYHLDGNFEPSHELIEQVGQNYFCHCMARGTIGIALSHISVLQDAFDSGFKTIWVMEDDIEVIRDPRIISQLNENI